MSGPNLNQADCWPSRVWDDHEGPGCGWLQRALILWTSNVKSTTAKLILTNEVSLRRLRPGFPRVTETARTVAWRKRRNAVGHSVWIPSSFMFGDLHSAATEPAARWRRSATTIDSSAFQIADAAKPKSLMKSCADSLKHQEGVRIVVAAALSQWSRTRPRRWDGPYNRTLTLRTLCNAHSPATMRTRTHAPGGHRHDRNRVCPLRSRLSRQSSCTSPFRNGSPSARCGCSLSWS